MHRMSQPPPHTHTTCQCKIPHTRAPGVQGAASAPLQKKPAGFATAPFSFCSYFLTSCGVQRMGCSLFCGLPSLRSGSSSGKARLVDPRPGYHFRHLSARVYNFCGFFVICCKMLQKPVHRSRNYGIFTARLRHYASFNLWSLYILL